MLLAYRGGPAEKEAYLKTIREHLAASNAPHKRRDFSAFSVFIRSESSMEWPTEHGFPAPLIECAKIIAADLPAGRRKTFVMTFLSLPKPGADLTRTWPKLAAWAISYFSADKSLAVLPHIRHLMSVSAKGYSALAAGRIRRIDWARSLEFLLAPRIGEYRWLLDDCDNLDLRLVETVIRASRTASGDPEQFSKTVNTKLLALMS